MLQVVTDDCGLQLTREPLDIKVILDPVIAGTCLLLDDPPWAHFLSTEVDDALVIADLEHGPLEDRVIQIVLPATVADEACGHSNQDGDT
jgi:hypothetical protein